MTDTAANRSIPVDAFVSLIMLIGSIPFMVQFGGRFYPDKPVG
jgi:hypothetical protein